MFKKKKKLKEGFDVGKINMETPDYEIKIDGVTPIDYATAINDRQKRVEKIEKDFEEKDKITDEFIEEQDDRRMNESSKAEQIKKQYKELEAKLEAEGKDIAKEKLEGPLHDLAMKYVEVSMKESCNSKYLKETSEDDLIVDMKKDGFEIYTLSEVDEETKKDMETDGATIAVELPERARTWYFKDMETMKKFFADGGKLDVDKPGLVEALPAIATAAITAAAAGAGSRLVDKVFGESASNKEMLYMRAENISDEIDALLTDLSGIENVNKYILDSEFDVLNKAVEILQDFAMMYSHVEKGEDLSEATENTEDRKFSVENTYVISGTEYGKKKVVIVAHRKTTDDFSIREVNSNYVFDDARLRFLTKEDAEKFIEAFEPYSSCDTLKVFPARNPVSVTKINTPYSDVVDCYVSETYIARNVDNETFTESEVAEEPKKRVRSANVKKEDKFYSEDDKFLQVYDDLSSEVENEGKGKEVNKQVKVPRGKRYVGPYVGPGDYDLTVYAKTREDLQWAEKIADHYGVKIDIKEDRNSTSNKYYPWKAILRDIK